MDCEVVCEDTSWIYVAHLDRKLLISRLQVTSLNTLTAVAFAGAFPFSTILVL